MKLADVPPGVKVNELARIHVPINMVQSNVVKEFPLLDMYRAGKVNHVLKFELATMTGYLNSFGARFCLNCLTKTVDEIDAFKHISSPVDLYGKSFPCLATSMSEKCYEIHDRTRKTLSHKSQGQIKINLDRLYMDPVMWWMLVYHLRKPSQRFGSWSSAEFPRRSRQRINSDRHCCWWSMCEYYNTHSII
jgi:hypothetical protein